MVNFSNIRNILVTIMFVMPIIILFGSGGSFLAVNLFLFSFSALSFLLIFITFPNAKFIYNYQNSFFYFFIYFVLLLITILISGGPIIHKVTFSLGFLLFLFSIIPAKNADALFSERIKFFATSTIVLSVITSVIYLFNIPYFENEEGRFQAWSGSPTTLSIYLLYMYLILRKSNKKRNTNILFFGVYIFLFILTGTRTSLLVLILIQIFEIKWIQLLVKSNFYISILLFIAIFFVIEPVYELIFKSGINKYLGRYEDQKDYSFLSRMFYTNEMLKVLYNSNALKFLFGHGLDFSFQLLNSSNEKIKILPHNDFLRSIIDQGFIFTFLFVNQFVGYFKKIGIAPLLVYFSSFFHNMMFDGYNLLLLFLSAFILYDSEKYNSPHF